MTLVSKEVEQFIGGQAKIFTEKNGCVYQGEIKNIITTRDRLILNFSWLAKKMVFSQKKWAFSEKIQYFLHLNSFEDDNGKKQVDCKDLPKHQVVFFSPIIGDVVVLLPPEYHNPLKKEDVSQKHSY